MKTIIAALFLLAACAAPASAQSTPLKITRIKSGGTTYTNADNVSVLRFGTGASLSGGVLDLSGVGNSRTIATSAPLGGGGNLNADRTLTCVTCVYLQATPTTAQNTGMIWLDGTAGGLLIGPLLNASAIQIFGSGGPHGAEIDSPLFDTPNQEAMNIGTGSATSVTVGNASHTTVVTLVAGAHTLTFDSTGALKVDGTTVTVP